MVSINTFTRLVSDVSNARFPPVEIIIKEALIILFCLGVASLVSGLLNFIWDQLEPRIRKSLLSYKKYRKKQSRLDPRVAKILGIKQGDKETVVFKEWRKIEAVLPMDIFQPLFVSIKTLLLVGFLACSGFIIGAFWFHNVAAAFTGAFLGILIPGNFLSKGDMKKQELYMKQLPSSIRTMAVTLESTGSIQLAIKEAAQNSPQPLKAVFEKVDSVLSSGKGIESAAMAVIKDIKFGHAKLLSVLIKEADKEGATMLPQFARLANQVDGMHDIAMENAVNLAPGKLSDMLLHILLIVIAFGITYVVPEARQYLTQEPLGRIIILCNFMSPVVSILTDRLFSKVEV